LFNQQKPSDTETKSDFSNPSKHSNISLNGLIKYYLGIDNPVKDELQLKMQKDIYFWLKVQKKIY